MTKLKTLLASIASIAAITALSSAQAALSLNVDTTNKAVFVTGTATGTLDMAESNLVYWLLSPSSGLQTEFDTDSALVSTNVSGDSFLNVSFRVQEVGYAFFIETDGIFTEASGNGSGAYLSYADWDPDAITVLEGSVGSALPLVYGTGWGSLDVVAGTIPEPSTAAALVGVLALAFVGLRRRRKA